MRQKLMVIAVAVMFGAFGYVLGTHSSQGYYDLGVHHAIADISNCSLEGARADKCFIPCSTDTDCLEKNGQSDH